MGRSVGWKRTGRKRLAGWHRVCGLDHAPPTDPNGSGDSWETRGTTRWQHGPPRGFGAGLLRGAAGGGGLGGGPPALDSGRDPGGKGGAGTGGRMGAAGRPDDTGGAWWGSEPRGHRHTRWLGGNDKDRERDRCGARHLRPMSRVPAAIWRQRLGFPVTRVPRTGPLSVVTHTKAPVR